MNRNQSRTAAGTAYRIGLAACGLAAAVTLGGCSSGQISQTANQLPAINGTAATIQTGSAGVDLRNVHLRAPQTGDSVKPASTIELLFVATNRSADKADKLLSITSNTGQVMINGSSEVPAGGVLLVGAPDGQKQSLPRGEDANTSIAMVVLTKPISNGLTYDFTFKFQNAGEKTIAVPISAGEAARREAGAPSGGSGGGDSHGAH